MAGIRSNCGDGYSKVKPTRNLRSALVAHGLQLAFRLPSPSSHIEPYAIMNALKGRVMADIELRFNRDMLVLSAPIDATLARQGIDSERDRQYLNAMEPDVVRDALRLELIAGAQCLVTTTQDITRARLAHLNMDHDVPRLAQAALAIATELKPQHILVEIGPCGLPLDPSSKASLNENRSQYADAARAFVEAAPSTPFDAFFLNGFASIPDLKCALMGVAQVSGKPVFASVSVGVLANHEGGASPSRPATSHVDRQSDAAEVIEGMAASYPFANAGLEVLDEIAPPPVPAAQRTLLDPALLPEAIGAMADLGASVVGFETPDGIADAVTYVKTAVDCTTLPVLAQVRVVPQPDGRPVGASRRGLVPLDAIEDYTPDTMQTAAVKLYGAGVQFLRAAGAATPAFTGALAAVVSGLDVKR